MKAQPLPREIRSKVIGLGTRICLLEQQIEKFRSFWGPKVVAGALEDLERYRKERRELRGY